MGMVEVEGRGVVADGYVLGAGVGGWLSQLTMLMSSGGSFFVALKVDYNNASTDCFTD